MVREQLFTDLQNFMQQSGPFAPFNVPDLLTAFRADIEGYVFHPQWTLDVALLSRTRIVRIIEGR